MGTLAQNRTYINARAEDCRSGGNTRGEPTVWFQGEAYFVIGFYFARRSGGQRDLYYVLRPTDSSGNGLHPLESDSQVAQTR